MGETLNKSGWSNIRYYIRTASLRPEYKIGILGTESRYWGHIPNFKHTLPVSLIWLFSTESIVGLVESTNKWIGVIVCVYEFD
jgi:hypothetical protein